VFEPGTFIPVTQAVISSTLELMPQPIYGEHYSIDRDPVWKHKPTPRPIDNFAWYQSDQLGTPMELTDTDGDISWRAFYKAWGARKEEESEKAINQETRNPLRFQGQYFDDETGLHYNRHRYYDPVTGRFISMDPIGFAGDLNVYTYTPNPIQWSDPLGLARVPPPAPGRPTLENTAGKFIPGPGSGHYKYWPQCNCKGYKDKGGDIWEPTDHNGTHAPHWDRQHPDGTHTPTYPVKTKGQK
jgi:RHS repeat-associated core domain